MNRKRLLLPLVLAPMLIASGCDADDHGGSKSGNYKRPKHLSVSADAPEAWRNECSACHIAYPPGLLPADAWRKQMEDLGNHYGSNASLDPKEEKIILDYLLEASADNRLPVEGGKPGEPPRITETRWFQRKHHEIRASTFQRPSIGSAANCVACHRGAEEGDFDEDKVKIPKRDRQAAENLTETSPRQEQFMGYTPSLPAEVKNAPVNNSCKVTTITSNIDCDTSMDASQKPKAVIVWTQAADGTWTCTVSGANNTGFAPKNCTYR